MTEQKSDIFRVKLTEYLNTKGVNDLRRFGRYLGLKEPTKLRKQPLIDQLVIHICDGVKQTRSGRGAPVKEKAWDSKMIEEIQALQSDCALQETFDPEREKRAQELKEQKTAQASKSNALTKLLKTAVNQKQNVQIVIPIESCTEKQMELLIEFFQESVKNT